ncbi:branched-chain amino acid ABC transporter permease [Thalassobaculum fulvum]|uniref:Branched-chain amino acid ABC transporter permease n=1 Tax=Thalassobaculum fulvum TaxID=1633335 RepID=A0A918XYJ5_9PROT|nr:urea ABC transporter permease subunit UrtB [Thalassobaculum fulvum]GHD62831.1 branched-chain amino acid ABC transporter permease [Thalassobaculum fulvum]
MHLATLLLDGANAVLILMLVALGLAIVFGLMNVINLAHGEFLMLGAYVVLAAGQAGLPFWVGLALAPPAVALVGLVAEEVLVRHTYTRLLDTILATWGLSLVLRQAAVLLYGPGSHSVVPPDLGAVTIAGSPYPVYRLVVMAISLTAIAATFALFFRTRFGLAARAVIANRAMASCLGIDTRRLDRWTFAVGAGLAGLAGAAMAPLIAVDPQAGLGWLVPAFLAILVGGLGSIAGPLVGAAGIGGLDSLTAAVASPVWAQLAVFVAAILVIRLRPTGLIARRRRES